MQDNQTEMTITISTDQPIADITFDLLQEALNNQHFVCMIASYQSPLEAHRAKAVYDLISLALQIHLQAL